MHANSANLHSTHSRYKPGKTVGIRYQPDGVQPLQGNVAALAAPPALRSSSSALREESSSPALKLQLHVLKLRVIFLIKVL